MRPALPLLFLLCAALPSLGGVPAGDDRYGLVGTGGRAFVARFGLLYFTLEGNYSAGNGNLFSSVHPASDPAPGFSVVREVAKLNVRTDALGETNAQFNAKLTGYAKSLASWYPLPSWMRGSKPTFTWFSPNAAALAAAESLQIVETIRREKARNPAITGTLWEIGNEPNLFPAILPAEYAALFTAYHRIIKAEDPEARVALGSLFLPEPSQDLKAKLAEELEAKMRAELQAAGLYNAVNAAGFFDDLVDDLKNTLLSRMLALPAREYLKQVLAATAARPDVVTLHAYPYDDRAPALDSAGLRHLLDTTLAGVSAQLASQGCPARIWITEFGNIEQGRDEAGVAARMEGLVEAFKASEAVQRWFHYKATGADEQFALFSSGTPPLTRLAQDAAFSPADGAFACAHLNAAGRAWYRLSHGGAGCAERLAFAAASSSRTEGGPAAIAVTLDAPAAGNVTVAWAIRGGSASAGDYSGGSGTLTFAPGETSKTLSFAAVDDALKEGEETAAIHLHSPVGALLSADSVHLAVLLDDDNASPTADSVRPASPAVAEGDSLRLRVHASDVEGDAIACVWRRQNGDTLGRGAEVVFRPGYRDAGTEVLRVDLIDARGGRTTREIVVAVANTALAPAVANGSGTAVSTGVPLRWAWPGGADPDLDEASLEARFEIRSDSASPDPAATALAAGSAGATVAAHLPAGPVWVRVRLRDGEGRESPWSPMVKLHWAGASSGLRAGGLPPVLDLTAFYGGKGGRAPLSPLYFRIALPQAARVRLERLAADGAATGALFEGRLPAGWHDVPARPGTAAIGAGRQILRLTAGGETRTLLIPYLP